MERFAVLLISDHDWNNSGPGRGSRAITHEPKQLLPSFAAERLQGACSLHKHIDMTIAIDEDHS